MKKKLRKIPYTHRIALVILVFTLLPCTLLEILYLKNARADWKKDILVDYQNTTDSVALIMSKTLTEMQSKMQYLMNDFEIRTYLTRVKNLPLSNALDFITSINRAVSSVTAGSPGMTVRWYPHESTLSYGEYCYTLELFAEEFLDGADDAAYQKILSLTEGTPLWLVRDIAREYNNKGTPQTMLCLYSQMTNLSGSSCILEIAIPITSLVKLTGQKVPVDSVLAICLNQSEEPLHIILDTSLEPDVGTELLQQYHHTKAIDQYEIVRSPISNSADSEVIYLIPTSYVSDLIRPKAAGFVSISLIIALAILGTCYLTSYFLTRRIIHALGTITSDLNNILTEPLVPDQNNDDIGQIVTQVRKLISDTQEYCMKIERYETEALRTELELLQMRFNPHLLYNTLDAIYYQVRNPVAKNTIEALCNYYRIVLNNGHLIIRIEDEIDMIKMYLSIVTFTYGLDSIAYEFEIDEHITKYTIIKHLLQPIVENALNHGIRPTGHGGTLHITAFSEADDVYIKVTDNGVGMTTDMAQKLLNEPSANVLGGGYGIYNVQQRIQVYYGKHYGLTIDSVPEKGTTVTVKMPKVLPEK